VSSACEKGYIILWNESSNSDGHWSIPPTSTKWTTTSHLNSLNTQKETTTYDIRRWQSSSIVLVLYIIFLKCKKINTNLNYLHCSFYSSSGAWEMGSFVLPLSTFLVNNLETAKIVSMKAENKYAVKYEIYGYKCMFRSQTTFKKKKLLVSLESSPLFSGPSLRFCSHMSLLFPNICKF